MEVSVMPRKEMTTNFLAGYVKYASAAVETKPEYHYACGLIALSSAIGNRTFLDLKGELKNYRADLWCLLTGPAGISRKTTAINCMKDVLPKDFHLYPQDWTWEGFMDELVEENTGLWLRDEFGGWLANNSKTYMAGTTEKLRRLYDNGSVTIRTRGLGSTVVDNIALSVLLGSTPGAVAKYMNVIEELENGLLSRILLISGDDIDMKGLWRAVPNLKKPKQSLTNKLVWIRKRATAAKRVVFEPSEEADIKGAFNAFFFRLKKKIDTSMDMASVYQRMLDVAFKIALMFALDEKRIIAPELTLKLNHAKDAIEITEKMLLPWYMRALEEIKASYTSLEADKTSMGETKLLKILKRKGKTHGTVKVLARSILYKHSNLGSLETFDSTIRSLIEKKQLYVMHKLGARGVQYAWTKGGNEIIPDGFFSSELADNTGDLIP